MPEKKKKTKKLKGVTVKYTDYNGNDLSHLIKYSYTHNGVKGGFYV
jgi:hypothetical protein